MILKRLKLENFLAHRDTAVDFSERGITVFIGENGAGKSSIVEGIFYGLFGKTDRGNISDLISWGKKQAKIELDFKKGNTEYRVERIITLRGSKPVTSATVFKKEGSRYIPYYQKHISKELPKITGITQKTFLSSILVKQGDIEGLLDLPAKERAKVFEDILDMSLYQLLVEHIAQKRKNLKVQMEAIDRATKSPDELQKEITQINSEIENLQTEKSRILEEISKIQKEIQKEEKELEFLLSEKEKNIKNKAKIDKAQELIKLKEKNIKQLNQKLSQIEKLKEKIPELEKNIKILRELEEKLRLINEIQVLKTKFTSIQEKIKEYSDKESIYKKQKQIAQEYIQKEKQLKEIKEQLKKAQKLKGEKNSLEIQLKKQEKKKEQFLQNLSSVLERLLNFKKSYLILKDNPLMIEQFIQNNRDRIEQLSKEKDEIREKKGALRAEGEELNKKIENLTGIEGNCPTCSRPLDSHTKEELIRDIQKHLEKKREEFRQLNKKEKNLSQEIEKEKQIESLLKEFKDHFDKYTEIQSEIKDIKTKLSVINAQLKTLQETVEKEKSIEEFLSKNREKYQLYIEAERYIKNTDIKSLKKSYSQIKEKLKTLLKKVNPEEREKIEKFFSELKESEKEYERIKQIISEEERIKEELDRLGKEIKENEKVIQETEKLILDDRKIEEKINFVKARINDLQQKLNRHRDELSGINEKIGKATGIRESLSKELQETEQNLKEIQRLKDKIEKYHRVEHALGPRGIQRIIRENALYELPRITNIIFSAFGFPFQQVKFNEDFDISLLAPTFEKTERYIPVSSISGGQRVALGLALRLAIGRFLSNRAEFLILDEPTVHLDQQRRNDLIDILISLKEKKFVNQLIVVTHDTEVEDAADSIYYVEKGSVKPLV
ncbi:exonuclease SbcC [Persephonella hydrogeniphila]|uniref:Exonuclease SbcC n=1 Tax=Persephonella hydrogeniphila TaxID=198703 RepID=A0A285NEV8_9AQUI|nr:AAA family ATPase [Persephonella hydrogeniphila]SNZ07808.1 exonuclease SbcC [Persephonella hydrogeniphila]